MTSETSDWIVIEREPGDWVVVDGSDASVRPVPVELGMALWRRDDLWPGTLSAALRALQSSPSPRALPYSLDVELLGSRLRLQSEDGEIAAHIQEDLGALAPRLRRSAEVLVCAAPGQPWNPAYHAVPGPRAGFQVRQRRGEVWEDVAPSLPVVPPVGSPPFAGRFLALHAALLVAPSGRGLLVCGDPGTGKTSAALWAGGIEGASVATDELAMLDLQTGLLYGIPIPLAVRQSGEEDGARTHLPLAKAGAVQGGAIRLRDVVVLEARGAGPRPPARAGSAQEAFGWVVPHLRWVGADAVSTIAGLTTLLEGAAVWKLAVCPGPALPAELARALERFFA